MSDNKPKPSMNEPNTSKSICAENIDDIDKLNASGTLEGLTFIQGVENQDASLDPSQLAHNQSSTNGLRSGSSSSRPSSGVRRVEVIGGDPKRDAQYHLEKKLEMSLLDTDSEDEGLQDIKSGRKSSNRDVKEYVNKIITDNEKIGSVIISTGTLFDSDTRAISGDTKSSAKVVKENATKTNRVLEPLPSTSNTGHDNFQKRERNALSENPNMLYYSNFFELSESKRSFAINLKDLVREVFIVLFFHLVLGIHNAIFNVITIDGIVTCIIFYMSFLGISEENNFLLRNRLMTLDRYIYYLLLFCGYYLFDYMTWYKFTTLLMYFASIMICPSIMGQIYDIYAYKKIRQVLYDGYNKLVQKIICKQLSKILNLVIKHVFNLKIVVGYEDLIPFYDRFSLMIINRFIVTFIMACIFNHIDKGGMKVPMMIYKNLYMKDAKYNISDDKKYIHQLIVDKQWEKFMDVYTLNRVIRLVVNDDAQNSMLSDQVSAFMNHVLFRFNRVMFCWTIMSISNLTVGVLSFLGFISSAERPLRYLINTAIFTGASFFTTERLLVLVICEACYPIIESKVLTDVSSDTYQSLKRGFLNIYYRTRLESVLLSILLSFASYYGRQSLGIIVVCVLNLIIMLRMAIRISYFKMDQTQSTMNKLINYPVKILTASGVLSKTDATKNPRHKYEDPPRDSITKSFDGVADSSARKPNGRRSRRIIGPIPNVLPRTAARTDPRSRVDSQGVNGVHRLTEDEIDETKLTISSPIIGDIDNIENSDILLILKERIKLTLKNNLLIRVINPFARISTPEIARMTGHIFFLLVLGYISSFNMIHIALLPIMIQNVIDVLF